MARTSSDLMNCLQPKGSNPCCPDCGMLECLCRPRFFAGQLLSEQDLNRLDQYIKNKNRLHNRHQHGWGVVNGLLVVCDPCGDVKVTQGYAVDPCGDDIVVCEETSVPICDLIRQCRQAEAQPDCQPFYQPPNTNCDELEEEWVLTVAYREWASRGITALRGNSCGTGGAMPGSGGDSCRCTGDAAKSSANAQATSSAQQRRGAPPECEATITCEGFGFSVYKKPEDEDSSDDDERLFQLEGAFWDAFDCCAQPLMDTIPPMPDFQGTTDPVTLANAITRWCCRFRDNLLNYFHTHRNTSCEIIDFLRAVNCPNIASPGTFWLDLLVSFLQLIAAWAEGLKNCLCLALLPPTPQGTCDLRVPLATVRIRARDCRVLSICNWTRERKIMVTWPAVSYWLSIVPIGDLIRRLLERLCCDSLLDVFDEVIGRLPEGASIGVTVRNASFNLDANVNAGPEASRVDSSLFSSGLHMASGALNARFAADLDTTVGGFAGLASAVAARGDKPLELGALLNAVSPRFKLPDNDQKLTAAEAKNLPLLLLSEITLKPFLGTLIGEGDAARKVAEFQANLGKEPQTSETTGELRKQLDEMRERLDRQDVQIESLLKKLKG